jgi:hypothetical protein
MPGNPAHKDVGDDAPWVSLRYFSLLASEIGKTVIGSNHQGGCDKLYN